MDYVPADVMNGKFELSLAAIDAELSFIESREFSIQISSPLQLERVERSVRVIGESDPLVKVVTALVLSHDGRWYFAKEPAEITPVDARVCNWITNITIGAESMPGPW